MPLARRAVPVAGEVQGKSRFAEAAAGIGPARRRRHLPARLGGAGRRVRLRPQQQAETSAGLRGQGEAAGRGQRIRQAACDLAQNCGQAGTFQTLLHDQQSLLGPAHPHQDHGALGQARFREARSVEPSPFQSGMGLLHAQHGPPPQAGRPQGKGEAKGNDCPLQSRRPAGGFMQAAERQPTPKGGIERRYAQRHPACVRLPGAVRLDGRNASPKPFELGGAER